MNYKKLENILLYFLLALITVIYLYTVSPTLAFWDCGEFIASAFTLAVPHPPGTPFYVLLGRVWLIIVGLFAGILPISKEVAWHMNLLGLGFTVLTVFLVYKMLLRIFRMWQGNNNKLSYLIITFGTCLGIAFYYTVWENAVETEVYAAATFVFILINNVSKGFFWMLMGVLGGIAPIFFMVTNGYILGWFSYSIVVEHGLGFTIAALFPHGVIEIPTLLLSSAAGMGLGYQLVNRIRGQGSLKEEFGKAIRLYAWRLSPLMIFAAVVEWYNRALPTLRPEFDSRSPHLF